MDLTIIIVNWNGGDLLLRCLQTIRESRTSFQVKVIVVDNDSHDGSRELAQQRFPEFHIFNSGSNLGFGKANNLARPLVKTPLVLFLNPDTELKPDTLERMVRLMTEKADVGAAGCMMRYVDGTVQEQGLQWYPRPLTAFLELFLANSFSRGMFHFCLPRLDPLRSAYARKLYGGFIVARKNVLDQAGWFDERYFMYAEDVDLCRTVSSFGWKLYYHADAEVVHVCGGTSEMAPSGFSVLMKNESVGKYMRKYYGWIGVILYRLAIGIAAVIRFLPAVPVYALCRNSRWRAALLKQSWMLLWAVGLKRARIPGSQRLAPPGLSRTAIAQAP